MGTEPSYDLDLLPSVQMQKEMRKFLKYRGQQLGAEKFYTERRFYHHLCKMLQTRRDRPESFLDWDKEKWKQQMKIWLLQQGLPLTEISKSHCGNETVSQAKTLHYIDRLIDYFLDLRDADVDEMTKDVWQLEKLDIQVKQDLTRCRLMLVGDTAQLPPVGEEESPSLSADKLRGYGMEVYEAQLTEVVRQMHDSGILWNATELRRYISEENFLTLPSVRVEGFPDIRMVSGSELIEVINDCYGQAGMDETIVVCRSNKRANIYNKGIRNTILFREDELNSGDLLMVAKNNYFWTEGCKEIDFIANGDIAVVRRVRRVREAYGFRFADVVLAFPDYDGMELEVKLLLDTLHTETPALPKELNDKLFYSVLEDYADITVKRERMKKMKADPHYNALQVKYAYAVTCHKAQGGQWKRVFLDQGYMTENMLTPDYFRWLYTAFTRATEILYLVNWPKEQTE